MNKNIRPSDFLTIFPLGSSAKKSEKEVVAIRILFIKSKQGDSWDLLTPAIYASYVTEKGFDELKNINKMYEMSSTLFEMGLVDPEAERHYFEEMNKLLISPQSAAKFHSGWKQIVEEK